MYIADSGNYRIRKVTVSTGFIATIAGTGSCCLLMIIWRLRLYYGILVALHWIQQVVIVVSSSFLLLSLMFLGNVYIADYCNCRIRKVTIATGTITTIAGNYYGCYYSGDDGAATSATLSYPVGIAVDSSGIIYLVLIIC